MTRGMDHDVPVVGDTVVIGNDLYRVSYREWLMRNETEPQLTIAIEKLRP